MKTTRNETADLNPTATAGDLALWLAHIPSEARISFRTIKGDRPFDADQHTITATWTVDSQENA